MSRMKEVFTPEETSPESLFEKVLKKQFCGSLEIEIRGHDKMKIGLAVHVVVPDKELRRYEKDEIIIYPFASLKDVRQYAALFRSIAENEYLFESQIKDKSETEKNCICTFTWTCSECGITNSDYYCRSEYDPWRSDTCYRCGHVTEILV